MKKSIKQSTLVLIFNTISIILIALSLLAFFIIIQINQSVDRANNDRYELISNARRFMEGSASLTNAVRAYAITGDLTYYNSYWNEVNILKNRDIGVGRMREIGITEDEDILIAEMFSISNAAIPYEEEAMYLAWEGKTGEAIGIVYGREYESMISSIGKRQVEFIDLLNERTENHLAAEMAKKENWMLLTLACLAVTAAIQVISTIAVNRKVIRPLQTVRDEMLEIERGNLRSEFNATPDTSEIGMLIGSIQSTKSELNKYISDILDKLAALADGKLDTRVEIEYIGNFVEIKQAINAIAQQLAQQHERNMRNHEELQEAYETANAANKAKTSFLSNMSHEIRTPLNAITGMTNIALSSGEIERKDQCLTKINDASIHLLGVINDILDMSKIDADKLVLSPVEFDFEKMVIRVVNVVNFRVDEKEQVLRVHIDPDIPRMLIADEQRLAQVLINLLSNAVKFTPENGEIQLRLQLKEKADGYCHILAHVRDNGIGISEEQQKKLFKPFVQADDNVSRKFGGTGLGLAISKNIIEKMDGTIQLKSREGQGTTITCTFRAQLGSSVDESIFQLAGIQWKNLRVLVVDDDPAICEYFQDLGEHMGFSCDAVTDGGQACKILEGFSGYDLFFVDYKMPGMDGIELTRRIRGNDIRNAVIIMISSVEWASIENEAKGAGVNRFIAKPLFPSVIADAISHSLGREISIHEPPDQQDMPDLNGHSILLVEDMEINREIVLALLEPTGVRITCAENGVQAVELMKARGQDFELIFMDLHMPEMDGEEATAHIRTMKDPHAKNIPIVAMTANVFREDIEKCKALGMNDHIGKPLDFDKVIDILKQYL